MPVNTSPSSHQPRSISEACVASISASPIHGTIQRTLLICGACVQVMPGSQAAAGRVPGEGRSSTGRMMHLIRMWTWAMQQQRQLQEASRAPGPSWLLTCARRGSSTARCSAARRHAARGSILLFLPCCGLDISMITTLTSLAVSSQQPTISMMCYHHVQSTHDQTSSQPLLALQAPRTGLQRPSKKPGAAGGGGGRGAGPGVNRNGFVPPFVQKALDGPGEEEGPYSPRVMELLAGGPIMHGVMRLVCDGSHACSYVYHSAQHLERRCSGHLTLCPCACVCSRSAEISQMPTLLRLPATQCLTHAACASVCSRRP